MDTTIQLKKLKTWIKRIKKFEIVDRQLGCDAYIAQCSVLLRLPEVAKASESL